MLQQYEADKDPNKTVHLLKAIQWIRKAWADLNPNTIQHCWWKSTIFAKPVEEVEVVGALEDQQTYELRQLQVDITQLPSIVDPLTAKEFLEIPGEVVEDEDGSNQEIFDQVVDQYAVDQEVDTTEDAIVDDEEDKTISVTEAIKLLERLYLFESQKEDGDEILLQCLNKAGKRYLFKKHESRKQRTIDSFFQQE